MLLQDMFQQAISQSESVLSLYDCIVTSSVRAARPEWKEKVKNSSIVDWPKKHDLWRSVCKDAIIIGNDKAQLRHKDFTEKSLRPLLRSAIVLAMSAIDKLLHEAIVKRFIRLVKDERLDNLVDIKLSSAYRIAMASRERKGRGGQKKKRPGHDIKNEVLDSLCTESFLSLRRLQEVCAMCGSESIFKCYGKSLNPEVRSLTLQSSTTAIGRLSGTGVTRPRAVPTSAYIDLGSR